MNKRGRIAIVEIFILVIAIFSFAYILGNDVKVVNGQSPLNTESGMTGAPQALSITTNPTDSIISYTNLETQIKTINTPEAFGGIGAKNVIQDTGGKIGSFDLAKNAIVTRTAQDTWLVNQNGQIIEVQGKLTLPSGGLPIKQLDLRMDTLQILMLLLVELIQ